MLIDIVIIIGLIVFEAVSSVDNAIVNAHMLRTMSARARKWFLIYGIFFAVFVARGLLPLLIVWITTPDVSFLGAIQSTFGGDPSAREAIESSKYILLIGGGMFLILLYLHWLFLEKKDPYFVPDKLIKEQHGVWFFALAAVLLVSILYLTRAEPLAMIAAAVGNAIFFILYGFRELAEKKEKNLEKAGNSDFSKLIYLEILDLSFSIDGIFGAFAFTTNILLILIGNGIGALIVRELTIKGMNKVAEYKWLKNGALTSIGFLGTFMVLEALSVPIPEWLPTVVTCLLVGITFWSSHKHIKKTKTV